MKDNFSTESDKYAKYRPTYPKEFYNYVNSLLLEKNNAWDCGTGNGQVAYELAKTFNKVYATDISQSQIDNAIHVDNIYYSVQPAEQTNFQNNMFDLIVVAQAIHWFDFDSFYTEVKRTSKHNALICVIGYGRIKISEKIDEIITNFYTKVIGHYWDKERKYIDENYETIPFPFDEIETLDFENKYQWNLDHFMGYLNTWSAVKHFIKHNGFNPLEKLKQEIVPFWNNNEEKKVNFPMLLRIGKV